MQSEVPVNLKSVNNTTNTTELTKVPITSHGTNFPKRDLVLSTTIPINRSLNASQSFATKNTIPTNPGDTFSTSVK